MKHVRLAHFLTLSALLMTSSVHAMYSGYPYADSDDDEPGQALVPYGTRPPQPYSSAVATTTPSWQTTAVSSYVPYIPDIETSLASIPGKIALTSMRMDTFVGFANDFWSIHGAQAFKHISKIQRIIGEDTFQRNLLRGFLDEHTYPKLGPCADDAIPGTFENLITLVSLYGETFAEKWSARTAQPLLEQLRALKVITTDQFRAYFDKRADAQEHGLWCAWNLVNKIRELQRELESPKKTLDDAKRDMAQYGNVMASARRRKLEAQIAEYSQDLDALMNLQLFGKPTAAAVRSAPSRPVIEEVAETAPSSRASSRPVARDAADDTGASGSGTNRAFQDAVDALPKGYELRSAERETVRRLIKVMIGRRNAVINDALLKYNLATRDEAGTMVRSPNLDTLMKEYRTNVRALLNAALSYITDPNELNKLGRDYTRALENSSTQRSEAGSSSSRATSSRPAAASSSTQPPRPASAHALPGAPRGALAITDGTSVAASSRPAQQEVSSRTSSSRPHGTAAPTASVAASSTHRSHVRRNGSTAAPSTSHASHVRRADASTAQTFQTAQSFVDSRASKKK